MSISKIFRSILDVDGSVPQKDLMKNFMALQASPMKLAHEEDQEIWDYINSYALQFGAMPTSQTVADYLERESDVTTQERLKEFVSIHSTYTRSDFENLVHELVEKQRTQDAHVLLKTANEILFDGMSIKEGYKVEHYKGYRDALNYIMKHADDLLTNESGVRTKIDIVEDVEASEEEFDRVLSADKLTWGCITGLDEIDVVCRGLKPGELWTHAAYTGQLKTTFALNWAYRAVFLLQWNVYYMSLEMPADQIRRIINVMHSNHPKFQGKGNPKLTYRLIRDGEDEQGNPITQEQEEFYRHVLHDIEEHKNTAYGSFYVHSPDENMTVPKLKRYMETRNAQVPVDMCVIDHFALMKPAESTGSYYTDLNSILRDAKRLALTFNQGEKVAMLGLLQMNRQGNLEAQKNDGVYKLQALADANEAERSSDVVTSTYLDTDLRARGRTKFGCLKNRDNPHFNPFTALIDWDTKYLSNELDFGNHAALLNADSDEAVMGLMAEDLMTEMNRVRAREREQERMRAQAREARAGGSTMEEALESLDEDFEADET